MLARRRKSRNPPAKMAIANFHHLAFGFVAAVGRGGGEGGLVDHVMLLMGGVYTVV